MKIRNLFMVLWMCFAVPAMAQKELDSIITASTTLLFDQPDQAIEMAQEVLSKATSPETKIRTLTFMSNAYLSKRENSKSLQTALQTLELLKEIDNLQMRVEVLNSIGMQHQQLRMYDKAKDYLDEALVLANTLESPEKISFLLAYNYTIRGFIYREQMNCEIAQNYFDRAISHFKTSDRSSHIANVSTLYYNKGNCFLQTAAIDSARISFQKSILFAEKVNASSLVSFAKKGLSEVYTAEGNYRLAVQELLEADSIASNVGDLVLNRGIYQNLSNNFLALGDRNQYELYDELFQKTNKSLLNQERKLINESLQNSLNSIQINSEKKVKNLEIIFYGILFGAGILLLFLVWMTFKSRKMFFDTKKELKRLSSQPSENQ